MADLAMAQAVDVAGSPKAEALTYRPILIGNAPNALINQIDSADLVQKGQKDAAIMFTCVVQKTGEIVWSGTYRGTADSKLLEQELQRRLAPATGAKFIPAIYKGTPVEAIYYGTVTFAVINNKPRLRIFSNQQPEELEKENDFIGPQPFYGLDSKFEGVHYPGKEDAPVQVDGVAELQLKIDATGNLQDIKLRQEQPPFLGFGEAAISDFKKAKFIPAFRGGKPVACDITMPVYYKAKKF